MLRLLLALCCAAMLTAAVSIDGPSTASGIVGSPFAWRIGATGSSQLTYGAIGLPTGLAINAQTGVISGTPTAATTDPLTITVSATAASGSASSTLELSITAAGSDGYATNATHITVTDGSACSFQLGASASTGVFTATGLPGSMAVSDAGLLSGIPSGAGVHNCAISRDGGTTATTMAITVLAARVGAPPVTETIHAQASIGSQFGYWIEAVGADAFACSNLPAWLSLDGGTGAISGTPATGAASANLQLTASTGALSTTTVMAVTVATPLIAGHVPIAPSLLEGTVGSGLGWRVATASATTLTADNLPPGLALDAASGLLTGTPASSGIFNTVITSTPGGSDLPVTTTVGVRIRNATAGAPTIGDLLPPRLTVGAPAAVSVPLADASAAATRFTISGATGYAIASNGVISGTPSAAGTPTVRITAINAAGSAVTTLMLQVQARTLAVPLPTSAASFRTTAGSSFAAILLADAAVDSWSVSGLPIGIDPAPFTGILSGTASAASISSIAVGPVDADGGNPTSIVIASDDAIAGAPVIGGVGPWYVSAGQPARIALQADIAASWSASGLPAGLTLASGTIRGTPTAAANANIAITATASAAARTTGLIVVEPEVAGAPVFTASGDLVAVLSTDFSATLAASGSPEEFTIAGGPAWLQLDGATGLLYGTPSETGVYTLPVTARNAAGTSRTTIVLRVYTTAPPPGGGGGTGGGDDGDAGVGGISGGGCGAGAAGLVLVVLLAGLRRGRNR